MSNFAELDVTTPGGPTMATEPTIPRWVRWEEDIWTDRTRSRNGWFACLRDPEHEDWTVCGRKIDNATVPDDDTVIGGAPLLCADCGLSSTP